MPAYATYPQTLPDPNLPVGEIGVPGPGYRQLELSANQPNIYSLSAGSQRKGSFANQRGYWTLTITYNKLPKDEFNILYSFLLSKKYSMEPFYVNLPQYGNPAVTQKSYVFSDKPYNQIFVNDGSGGSSILPNPGDMFVLEDVDNYYGLYRVLRVEDSVTNMQARTFGISDERYTIWPTLPLSVQLSFVSANFTFDNIRLYGKITGDISYKIGDDNLYSISPITVTEVRPNV